MRSRSGCRLALRGRWLGRLGGEDAEGLVVGVAGEEGLRGFEEEMVGGRGLGEEGHGGVELEVVGAAEDLADWVGSRVEHELRAFEKARAEDRVGQVGRGFGEGWDGVGLGCGAGAQAADLGEDEPDPVRGLAVGA